MRIIQGDFVGTGLRIGIVVSRSNEFITRQLLAGVLDGLRRHGVDKDAVTVVYVPGAFELPLVCRKLAEMGNIDGVIALGALIHGAASHDDHIASAATSGIAQASIETGVPCILGLLSTETIEQAIERAGTSAGNKGFEAATTAIEMARLMKALRS